MEFQQVVQSRRMVRSFEERPIPPGIVDRILANARRAPSAGYSQGWAFLVLEGKEQLERFWDIVTPPAQRHTSRWPTLHHAPLVIVPFSHKNAYLERYAEADKGWTDRDESRWPVPFWHIDAGFASMLMLLTAVDAGLGALFFGVTTAGPLRDAFGVPVDYEPIGALAIGFPAPDEPSPSLRRGRRPVAEVIHRGHWVE